MWIGWLIVLYMIVIVQLLFLLIYFGLIRPSKIHWTHTNFVMASLAGVFYLAVIFGFPIMIKHEKKATKDRSSVTARKQARAFVVTSIVALISFPVPFFIAY